MVGIIATRNKGSHIALFFVEGKYHRQGIGRKLFNGILENNSYSKITVNSSLYAADVYHKLGFCDIYCDIYTEQVINGVRFIPMELKL